MGKMKSILFRYLQLAVVVNVALATLAGGIVSAQTGVGTPPLATLQMRKPSLPASATSRRAPTAKKPMTPFERIIAPHLADFMKQDAAGRPSHSAVQRPRPHTGAAGANGSTVNFPGFLSAPFLTIQDGDSSPAFNTVSGDFNKRWPCRCCGSQRRRSHRRSPESRLIYQYRYSVSNRIE